MDIADELKEAPSLTDDELVHLSEESLKIEKHFEEPTDIEWAFSLDDSSNARLYFLQARPMKPLPEYKDPIDKIMDIMLG